MKDVLKDICYLIIVFAIAWFTFYLTMRHDTLEKKLSRYDCSLAQTISSFPEEIREGCKNKHIEELNKLKE